ncbi:hypothetical protein HDU86_004508 [Geranomyces michiganensis]|nr:hypothetical protein HDU86_004508 [Geranomyces michiganensis]
MRNPTANTAADDARMALATPPESKSVFRLTKKASVITHPGTPATPSGGLGPPSPLGILDAFPPAVLLKVLRVCAPELRTVRNLSTRYRELVERYIAKRTKRFQESIEEAECWGHRAPTLSDLVHLDPLALANILEVHYGSKLARAGQVGSGGAAVATLTSPSEVGGRSEMGDDDTRTDGGASQAPRGGGAQAKTMKRETMQRIVYAAFRTALDDYEEGCHATIPVLRAFLIRHGLQYFGGGFDGRSAGADWSGGAVVPDDQSERDVSDGVSLRSAIALTMGGGGNGSGVGSASRSKSTDGSLNLTQLAKDSNWLKLNSELHRHAAMHGHAGNLPALCDVEDPAGSLAEGADLAVRAHRPATLVACLDAARMYGCLWATIDRGLQAALAADRWGRRVPVEVLLVLLDATFNDNLGPWAFCAATRGWGFEGANSNSGQGDARMSMAARDLLVRAEECAKLYGIAWHRLSTLGGFAVAPVEEVAREVRGRLKIMM